MLERCSYNAVKKVDTAALVESARSGDSDAFGELIGRHRTLIRRTALSYLKNYEDAEDVIQDVSISVFRKLHTFEGTAAFSTWLTRIAINASLQRLRQARSKRAVAFSDLAECGEESFLDVPDPMPDPEQQCSVHEMRNRVNLAVSRLPLPLRQVALDHFYAELPMREVAGKSGLSLAATKSRAYRAKRMLIAILGQ